MPSLSLKWGTLKRWNFNDSPKGMELLKEYVEIGYSVSTLAQDDTPRQKEIICELIDLVPDGDVYLDWHGEKVSNESAKKYVLEYGPRTPVS